MMIIGDFFVPYNPLFSNGHTLPFLDLSCLYCGRSHIGRAAVQGFPWRETPELPRSFRWLDRWNGYMNNHPEPGLLMRLMLRLITTMSENIYLLITMLFIDHNNWIKSLITLFKLLGKNNYIGLKIDLYTFLLHFLL